MGVEEEDKETHQVPFLVDKSLDKLPTRKSSSYIHVTFLPYKEHDWCYSQCQYEWYKSEVV